MQPRASVDRTGLGSLSAANQKRSDQPATRQLKIPLRDHAIRQCHFCDELARQGDWRAGDCHFHERPVYDQKVSTFRSGPVFFRG